MEDDLGLPEPEEPNEEDAGIKLRSGRIISRPKVLIAEGLVERHQAHVVETYHAYQKAHEADRLTKPFKSEKFDEKTRTHQMLMAMNWGSTLNGLRNSPLLRNMIKVNHQDDTIEEMHPAILMAKAKDSSADNPMWLEAMNGPDAKGYWKAYQIKIEVLQTNDTWDVVTREPWMNVIPGIWAFKCKCYFNG